MQGIGCGIAVNFGKIPFKFDLQDLIKKTKDEIIEEITQEEVRSEDIHFLIKNHLEVHGFADTLAHFERKDEDTFKSFLVHRQDFKAAEIIRE